ADIVRAGGLERLLVDGGGHDGADRALHGQPRALFDVLDRGAAARGGDLAEGDLVTPQVLHIEDVDGAAHADSVGGPGDGADREGLAGDLRALFDGPGGADDDGRAEAIDALFGERLGDDFRPDTGGIAHGDGEDGLRHVG